MVGSMPPLHFTSHARNVSADLVGKSTTEEDI
jgi:hypothetical protein